MLVLAAACSFSSEQTAASDFPVEATSSTTDGPTTIQPPTPTTITTTTTTTIMTTQATVDMGDLAGWAFAPVSLGDRTLVVAVADDPIERAQGLMGVDDLGDLDGMLFVFPDEAMTSFWMKDTLISLDIAFFKADGLLVDAFPMEPCLTEQCPVYTPSGRFALALETPAGLLGELSLDARLVVNNG